MPMPMELQHAQEEFEKFLKDVGERSGLTTRNQVYTLVQAVLLTFRRRLSPEESLAFAQILPPILRAIFIADWKARECRRLFTAPDDLVREVQSLRRDHNFAPESAIRDVAAALRDRVDQGAFDALLEALPSGAAAFWQRS